MRLAMILVLALTFGCAGAAGVLPGLGQINTTPHVCNPGENCEVPDLGPCPDGQEPTDIALNLDTGKWEKVCPEPVAPAE